MKVCANRFSCFSLITLLLLIPAGATNAGLINADPASQDLSPVGDWLPEETQQALSSGGELASLTSALHPSGGVDTGVPRGWQDMEALLVAAGADADAVAPAPTVKRAGKQAAEQGFGLAIHGFLAVVASVIGLVTVVIWRTLKTLPRAARTAGRIGRLRS